MFCLQAVNGVLNRRKCQYNQREHAFSADVKDIVKETVPDRVHALRCKFSEEEKTGKEGTAESAKDCDKISDIEAMLFIGE